MCFIVRVKEGVYIHNKITFIKNELSCFSDFSQIARKILSDFLRKSKFVIINVTLVSNFLHVLYIVYNVLELLLL